MYEALRDLPVCVSILWKLYGVRDDGTVQILARDVLKCRF